MRSPAAERRRPTPWDAVVALAVVAFAVVLIFLLRGKMLEVKEKMVN